MKQLGHIRKAHHISRESTSPEPDPAPAPRARRPVIDPNASPPLNRIARAPTVPALFEEDEEEDDDDAGGTQLLPLHYQPTTPRTPAKSPGRPGSKTTRLSDVWDEREELFDIGEESEDEDGPRAGGPPPPPKIVVSGE